MSISKVSFSDLEDAFLDSSDNYHYWLDKRTGEVLFVDEEIARSLERDEDLSNAPKWQRELIEQARRVLRAFGELPGQEDDDSEIELGRYVEIPKQESRDGYEDMEDFAETVTNPHLRDLLAVALRGKGAFRRFKDVLLGYPAERERWFSYRADLLHWHIRQWLEQHEIIATNDPPWGSVEPPQELPAVGRPVVHGSEAPGEALRRNARELIETIAAIELPTAIAFLEFLKQRSAEQLARDEADDDPGGL